MWTNDVVQEASQALVRVAITFHYLEGRLGFLAEVIRGFASFAVTSIKLDIYTNSVNLDEHQKIMSIINSTGIDASIIVVYDMEHPYHLAWAHKADIRRWLDEPAKENTHFIYVEDDERMTWENFLYLVFARRELKLFGLLPGLVRYEWNALKSCFVSLDISSVIGLAQSRYVRGRDWSYIEPKQPYCGSFILDREAAEEYIRTPSFDREKSEFIQWNIRERAAAGLTWERIPALFSSRIVVPVDTKKKSVVPVCWLAHLPNNYAEDINTPHSKISMSDLLTGALDPIKLVAAEDLLKSN